MSSHSDTWTSSEIFFIIIMDVRHMIEEGVAQEIHINA